jgi:hypothetical protein
VVARADVRAPDLVSGCELRQLGQRVGLGDRRVSISGASRRIEAGTASRISAGSDGWPIAASIRATCSPCGPM